MPSVWAKSLPEPTGRTARAGRTASSCAIKPLTTSWITPSPPSAITVRYPWARVASSLACPMRSVSTRSNWDARAVMSKKRCRRSATSRAAPDWAAGLAMMSVRPKSVACMGRLPAYDVTVRSRSGRIAPDCGCTANIYVYSIRSLWRSIASATVPPSSTISERRLGEMIRWAGYTPRCPPTR